MQRTTEGGWQNPSRTSEVHGGILTEPQQVSHHGHQGLQKTTNTKNTPRGSEMPKPTPRVPKHQKVSGTPSADTKTPKTDSAGPKTPKVPRTSSADTKRPKTTSETPRTLRMADSVGQNLLRTPKV